MRLRPAYDSVVAGIGWMVLTTLLFVCVTGIVRHVGTDVAAVEAALITAVVVATVVAAIMAVALLARLAAIVVARLLVGADRVALVAEIVVEVEIVARAAIAALVLLLEATALIGQHAEIVIGELEIIFGVDAIARKLRVAGHVAIFLKQLGGVAARTTVDPVVDY